MKSAKKWMVFFCTGLLLASIVLAQPQLSHATFVISEQFGELPELDELPEDGAPTPTPSPSPVLSVSPSPSPVPTPIATPEPTEPPVRYGVTTKGGVNVRVEGSPRARPLFQVMHSGTGFIILDDAETAGTVWYHVEFADERTGYIRGDMVREVTETEYLQIAPEGTGAPGTVG